jgi:hypothetical protein
VQELPPHSIRPYSPYCAARPHVTAAPSAHPSRLRPQAWVLAALTDEDRAARYGLTAALYASPLLLRGLDWSEPWALAMLVLCATHVQVWPCPARHGVAAVRRAPM